MFNLLFDAARQGDWVCDEFLLPIRCHWMATVSRSIQKSNLSIILELIIYWNLDKISWTILLNSPSLMPFWAAVAFNIGWIKIKLLSSRIRLWYLQDEKILISNIPKVYMHMILNESFWCNRQFFLSFLSYQNLTSFCLRTFPLDRIGRNFVHLSENWIVLTF